MVTRLPTTTARRRDRIIWALGLALLPVGCLVLYWNNPEDSSLFPACPFRTLTGLDCPGCGSTRALHHVLRLDVGTAISFNLLTVAALPFLLYAAASKAVSAFTDRQPSTRRIPATLIWALGAGILMFWLARNLPFEAVAWMGTAQ